MTCLRSAQKAGSIRQRPSREGLTPVSFCPDTAVHAAKEAPGMSICIQTHVERSFSKTPGQGTRLYYPTCVRQRCWGRGLDLALLSLRCASCILRSNNRQGCLEALLFG